MGAQRAAIGCPHGCILSSSGICNLELPWALQGGPRVQDGTVPSHLHRQAWRELDTVLAERGRLLPTYGACAQARSQIDLVSFTPHRRHSVHFTGGDAESLNRCLRLHSPQGEMGLCKFSGRSRSLKHFWWRGRVPRLCNSVPPQGACPGLGVSSCSQHPCLPPPSFSGRSWAGPTGHLPWSPSGQQGSSPGVCGRCGSVSRGWCCG